MLYTRVLAMGVSPQRVDSTGWDAPAADSAGPATRRPQAATR